MIVGVEVDRNVRFFCENAAFELVLPHPVNANIFRQQLYAFAEQHSASSQPLDGSPDWEDEDSGLLVVSWPGLYLERELLEQDHAVTLLALTSLLPPMRSTDLRSHHPGALAPGLGSAPIGTGDDLFEDETDDDGGAPDRGPFSNLQDEAHSTIPVANEHDEGIGSPTTSPEDPPAQASSDTAPGPDP